MNTFLSKYLIYIIYAIVIVIETIIWLACGTMIPYLVVILAIGALLAVLEICFAYPFAKWNNKWYSRWHNKNRAQTDDGSFEPSSYAIFSTKISGYLIIALFQVIFCIFIF